MGGPGRVFRAGLLLLVVAVLALENAPADDRPDYFYLDESYHSLLARKGRMSFSLLPRYYNTRGLFHGSGEWFFYGQAGRKILGASWLLDIGDRVGFAAYSGVVDYGWEHNSGTGLGESWGRIKVRPTPSLPLWIRLAVRDPGDLDFSQYQPLTRAADLSLAWEGSAKRWALNLFGGYRKRFSEARYEPGDELHALAEFALREEVNGLSAGLCGHYGFPGRFAGAEVADSDGYLVSFLLRYFSSLTPRTWWQLTFLYDIVGKNRIGGFLFSGSVSLHF